MYFACCKYINLNFENFYFILFCFNYIIVLFSFFVHDSLILAHAIGVLLYLCIALVWFNIKKKKEKKRKGAVMTEKKRHTRKNQEERTLHVRSCSARWCDQVSQGIWYP